MRFTSRFNAVGGITDFVAYFRQPTPYRWPFLLISCLMTFGLLFLIMRESVFVPPDPPKVIYISTFAEGRSDAEIYQSNLENQQRKEAREAAKAAAEQRAIDAYRTLGRATGLDVDAMEENARAEHAREAAREREQRKELYGAGRTGADKPE